MNQDFHPSLIPVLPSQGMEAGNEVTSTQVFVTSTLPDCKQWEAALGFMHQSLELISSQELMNMLKSS